VPAWLEICLKLSLLVEEGKVSLALVIIGSREAPTFASNTCRVSGESNSGQAITFATPSAHLQEVTHTIHPEPTLHVHHKTLDVNSIRRPILSYDLTSRPPTMNIVGTSCFNNVYSSLRTLRITQ
jgi:hypothetical protein